MSQIATCNGYFVVADTVGKEANTIAMEVGPFNMVFDKKTGVTTAFPESNHLEPNSQDWKNAIMLLTRCAAFAKGASGVSDKDAKDAMLTVLEAVLNE